MKNMNFNKREMEGNEIMKFLIYNGFCVLWVIRRYKSEKLAKRKTIIARNRWNMLDWRRIMDFRKNHLSKRLNINVADIFKRTVSKKCTPITGEFYFKVQTVAQYAAHFVRQRKYVKFKPGFQSPENDCKE